jgi:fructose-1-phosphate kinase PfkB-like protein
VNATPAPFITFTGNLLAERTLTFADWSPGQTQRARAESVQVGGKGINVSRRLRQLGAPTLALCFAGGATGEECTARREEEGLPFHAFEAERPTRAGTVVRGGPGGETTFLGPDAAPGETAVRMCADFLDAQPAGVLAVCGSIPGWEDPGCDWLRAALERWLARGTLVADTYGPPLAWLAERPLALVKINRTEFDGLFPPAPDRLDVGARLSAITGAARPRAWVVTDGPGPVWLRDGDAPAERLLPPVVREVSATGSGDLLLGCILEARWRRGRPLREAVAEALPVAAAHAARPLNP